MDIHKDCYSAIDLTQQGGETERTARPLDQLELTRKELETAATEDELAAENCSAKFTFINQRL
jgi:hypothetical protein